MNGSAASFKARAILFDMDGTLVDSTPVVAKTWARWAEQRGLDAAEVVEFAHGRPTADVVRRFAPEMDAAAEAGRLLAEEELDPTPVIPIPGAPEAVAAARQYAKWAVVTSASRKLAEMRLSGGGYPMPPVLISTDDIKRGKPDPEGYLQAAQMLGVNPAECVVFEDTPAGLEAGRAAGARTVGVTTTFRAQDLSADIILPDFSFLDLKPFGAGWLEIAVRRTVHARS